MPSTPTRPPLSLVAAAALLLATMLAGSYVDLLSDRLHARQLAISTQLERIVRLNQELGAMLTTAVLDRNTLRSASYPTIQSELERTVTAVQALTGDLTLAADMVALGAELASLRARELEALERMEAREWPQAQAILFGNEYSLARKIYEINSETAIGALNGELAHTSETYAQIRHLSLFARIAAFVLLLWAALVYSRRLREELRKQARLHEEIGAANRRLEDNVRARTAELERANRLLAGLSTTDSLTGLANRRRFDEALEAEWQRAVRTRMPLSLLMLDIDHFKLYNDHLGHLAGDECLRQIGAVLQACVLRSGELSARYGGEEFAVILPAAEPEEAARLAETIRCEVENLGLAHVPEANARVVTASIGVATHRPIPGEPSTRLIQDADRALYESKRAGRNRVVVHAPAERADLADKGADPAPQASASSTPPTASSQ